jgi:hypothetical protein
MNKKKDPGICRDLLSLKFVRIFCSTTGSRLPCKKEVKIKKSVSFVVDHV